MIILAVTFLTF